MPMLKVQRLSVGGRWNVDKVNENGQYFVDVCTERDLFLSNTLWHKLIHRYTWARGNEMSLIDYKTVEDKRL